MAMRRMRRYKKRTPYKRASRKYVRNKRGPAPNRLNYTSTLGEGATTLAGSFRNKRRNYKTWIRQQIRSGDSSTHYRSILSIASLVTSGSLGSSVNFRFFHNGNFWQTAGGLLNLDVVNPNFTNGDLMIRGGLCKLLITNPSATQTVEVTSWILQTTMLGPALTQINVDPAWDPSCTGDFQQLYKFREPITTTLAPLESCTRHSYLRPQKIDQDMFQNNRNRQAWCFKWVNLTSSAVTSVAVDSRHNMSFTGDITAP